MEVGLDVVATLGLAPTSPTTEETAEEVTEVAHVLHAEGLAATTGEATRSAEPCSCRAHLADLVVLLALLGIAQDLIGRGDLLEAILRTGVGVRVVLLGQLAVRTREVLLGHVLWNAQDLVVVLLEPLTLNGHVLPLHPAHRWTEHVAPPAVPRSEHLFHDCSLLTLVAGAVHDRIVHRRVELDTGGIDAL